MLYQDIWGPAARAISKKMEVFPTRREEPLIEVRATNGALSYIAHSDAKFVELAVSNRDGGIRLIVTDCAAKKQTTSIVPPEGAKEPVEQFTQDWCPRAGVTGKPAKVEDLDQTAERTRVQTLTWEVLSLSEKAPQINAKIGDAARTRLQKRVSTAVAKDEENTFH
jgi:hypothetical protein